MRALLTGITGQDGSYLAEFLLEKGYEVFGLVRRLSTPNFWRIEHIFDKIHIIEGDITDQNSLNNAMKVAEPDEVYNLAAQSFVATSWVQPEQTMNVNALGCLRVLEAIKQFNQKAKFYQASSSEMFGKVKEIPQKETTPFHPRSPYGVSKVAAYWITVNYRESYDIFACNGILFNHASSRRGIEFVSKKITDAAVRIKLGMAKELVLGNLDAKRDWGYAKDYVVAMWLMLQQEAPDDYVIATGETHSIREFLDEAFRCAGIGDWSGYVRQDKRFFRPVDVNLLIGDYSKAKRVLGWEPQTKFKDLVKLMVDFDLERLNK